MRTLRLVSDSTEESESSDTSVQPVHAREKEKAQAVSPTSLSQEAAISHMYEYAGPRQGTRIASIGSTGSGKTWFQRKLIAYASRRDDLVLVHDIKDKTPQYQGCIRDSAFSLVRNPATGNVIIFRNEDPERVAELAWKSSAQGVTCTVLIDEIYDAMSAPMHWKAKGASRIDEIYRKGRSRGVTIVGSVQAPQWLPTTTLTQSDFKIIFRLDARSLDYAQKSLRLTSRETETIRKLEIGQFIMVQQGKDWNGVIYGPH